MKITRRQLLEMIQGQLSEAPVMSDEEVGNAMITHIMKNMLSDQQIKELKEWYVNYSIEYTKGRGYTEPSRDQVDDMRRMTDILFSKMRRGTL